MKKSHRAGPAGPTLCEKDFHESFHIGAFKKNMFHLFWKIQQEYHIQLCLLLAPHRMGPVGPARCEKDFQRVFHKGVVKHTLST